MRAITISDGEKRHRINGDQITSVDRRAGNEHPGVYIHGAGINTAVFVPEPQATAFLEWWDAEARRYGGYIGATDPQTAANDGTDWVPVPGDRVALKTHSPFASPETYLGVVRGWDDTLEGYVIVAWDDGKITNEAINALQRRP